MSSKLNSIFFNFIWNSKTEKVKRKIITQNYENGGLKMIRIDTFIFSMKLTWINRLLTKTSKYVELFESTVSSMNKLINRGKVFKIQSKTTSGGMFLRLGCYL